MPRGRAGGAAPAGGSRRRWLGALLLLGGVALVLVSPLIGPVPIPVESSLGILAHGPGPVSSPGACPGIHVSANQCRIWAEIVWQARIPAMLLALAAGAILGLSGATLQGVFRNSLADPYLLGLSTGAAMGAAILFVFDVDVAQAAFALPAFAFLGGLIPGLVIFIVGRVARRSAETLVLTGVALGAVFASLLATFLLYNPIADLQVSFWLLGGMSDATWTHDALLFGVLLAVGGVLSLLGRELNLLQLGEDVAQSVGVPVQRVTLTLVLLTTVATAAAVAFTGVIGFVGLVSPHIVRRVVGPDYRLVVPLAGLVGAGFLLLAWDIAQTALPPIVLPVGIPTSFVGAPFFLYLLLRRRAVPGASV
ncbi:MAG: iron ABC transporter permease [Thermoplasmata archaeon]|nr:iron ABC transporter permease [Thermoplasmata archaeon]